ncbi:MAG: TaqI-like C-terminal specificity domain-containing protein [Bacteroidales bacterium]|nr:TaqI-like C-terminal specificity domain-containing protein [Bacteroidales bacterium]
MIEDQDDNKLDSKALFNKLVCRESLTISVEDIKKDFSQNWGLAFFLTKDENRIVRNIESNTVTLKTYFPEVSQGIIAYDKLKGVSTNEIDNRVFHSENYREGYRKWLRGFDVNKYSVVWNTPSVKTSGKQTDKEIYVDYDNIPKARERKYFIGKRMLVREITNPFIFAAITDEELYHDPAILVIKDSTKYSLELTCGILNSQLATFYHFRHSPKATKGAFPKIMISDIKNFPLPVVDNSEYADKITSLVRNIQTYIENAEADKEKIPELEWQIDYWVFKLYGMKDADIKIIAEDFFDKKPSDFIITSEGE